MRKEPGQHSLQAAAAIQVVYKLSTHTYRELWNGHLRTLRIYSPLLNKWKRTEEEELISPV